MAAGLGFKDFTTGEVLTAADVDGYLMQGIWVFASTAARDASVTSPSEGNFAFTKDTNSLWYYDGAAWVASGATGDIEGVTAGIGISGGGTSGTVTVTNSMATAIDAKGDLVAGTGADTFAKLTVGANDTVLTADSTAATGLKWATPAAGGGMTLLSTTTMTTTTTTISSISGSYKELIFIMQGVNLGSTGTIYINPNGSTSDTAGILVSTIGSPTASAETRIKTVTNVVGPNTNNSMTLVFPEYASGSYVKNYYGSQGFQNSGNWAGSMAGTYFSTTAISSISIVCDTTPSAGRVLIYGVN